MNHQTSDFLAEKLRQNWITRYQGLKQEKEQEEDDSLTNLAWLQNINLTKISVQDGRPLSPLVSPSWPHSNVAYRNQGLKAPSEKALRNTLELYRHHCNNYGSGNRQNQSLRMQAAASRQSFEHFNTYNRNRHATRQPSAWWKMKGQRTIFRHRNTPPNRLKLQIDMRPAGKFNNCQFIKGLSQTAPYSGLTTTNCYQFSSNKNAPTFVTMTPTQEQIFPISTDGNYTDKFISQSRNHIGLTGTYLNENSSFKQDPGQSNDQYSTCTLPMIDDLDPSERQMFRTNQSVRPPYSYTVLIYMSMEATKKTKITLNDIYSWIAENFSFYRNSEPTCKLALRHTLMRSNFFQRVPRRKEEPGGWGDIWRLNPEIRTQLKDSFHRNITIKHERDENIASIPTLTNDSRTKDCESNNKQLALTSALHVRSPSGDSWSNIHNSTSSSSPASVRLYTPPPNDNSDCFASPVAPTFGFLEDVSLLHDSIKNCHTILDDINEPRLKSTRNLDTLLCSENNAAEQMKDYKKMQQPTTSSEKLSNSTQGTGFKKTDWWPDDLTDSVSTLIDNLSDHSYNEQKDKTQKNYHTTSTLNGNTNDYSIEPQALLSDEHPWVDDRLNLEELDTILGLN